MSGLLYLKRLLKEGGNKMGYYISNIIAIRTGGVFSGATDTKDVKKRISKIIIEMRKDKTFCPDLGDDNGDPSHCMSKELNAHKGSYIVIAGVFNYWHYDEVVEFVKRISKEFGTEVMIMSWDEQIDEVQCNWKTII